MVRKIKFWITFLLKVLFLSPRLFFSFIWNYIILNALLRIRKKLNVRFNRTYLNWPNEHWFYYISIEVFYRKIYSKLVDCNHVLDLGWYLWESSIWFAQYNKKITVVEANKNNYSYILQNTKDYKNINAILGAITYKNNSKLYLSWDDYSAWWKVTSIKSWDEIINIHIEDIWADDIDCIKIDIEGWEYDIIDFIQFYKKKLKKWYIEFHEINKNSCKIDIFLNYLNKNWYNIEFENTYWKNIKYDTFIKSDIAVIYFFK